MTAKWDIYCGGMEDNVSIAFINARIFDPATEYDTYGTMLTKGNLIEDYGSDIDYSKADKVIDCNRKMLIPGLIDIHVHFREPGFEHKEDIGSGSRAAAAGGVTTVVCQPNTNPVINSKLVTRYIKTKAQEESSVRVLFYASVTSDNGTLSDMGILKNEGAVGFTDDGLPVSNAALMLEALRYATVLGLPIAQHAEDLNLSSKGCMNEGPASEDLGLIGIPAVSESIMVERDISLTKLVKNAHYHVLHVSSADSLETIKQAKAKGMKVTCEVAPHHFILSDDAVKEYGALAKMNPPLRSENDRLKMIDGLRDGTIDCIATDHAPHELPSKEKSLENAAFGIIGLETMLPLSLKLYHDGIMSLRDVLQKMTSAPADVLNLPYGRLIKGRSADFAIIDPDFEYNIDLSESASKSRNSPFHGMKVKGKCIMTVVGGKVVFEA